MTLWTRKGRHRLPTWVAAGVTLVALGTWGVRSPWLSDVRALAMTAMRRGTEATTPHRAPAHSREAKEGSSLLPLYTRWQSFTTADGLPSNKVFCVRVDGNRVWAGTDAGLACYEGGRWRAYSVEDGLPGPQVLCLEVSPRTGDLWIGTMEGLVRYSAGRFDVFDQLNSGLSNNFVNDIACDPDRNEIWVDTAMGLSRFNLATETWTIYDSTNTPMHEPWTYSVAVDRGLVYVGVWGGGILEYDIARDRWREYRDPDKEFELDLLANDGPVTDVTAGIDFVDGILWHVTYFGAARYDGHQWQTYYEDDSGLASNFIQFVRGRGPTGWMCTDSGISGTDGKRWVTYRRLPDGRGEILLTRTNGSVVRQTISSALAHNYVLGVDFDITGIWVATSGGISHGMPSDHPGTSSRVGL